MVKQILDLTFHHRCDVMCLLKQQTSITVCLPTKEKKLPLFVFPLQQQTELALFP
jgi:hypothetical protein